MVGGFIDALHIRLKKQHGQVVSQAQVETSECLDFMNGTFFFNSTL